MMVLTVPLGDFLSGHRVPLPTSWLPTSGSGQAQIGKIEPAATPAAPVRSLATCRRPPSAPGVTLTVPKPTGVRALDRGGKPASQERRSVVQRQATALVELSVAEAEDRLVLDWSEPLRHGAWYKAVYRPAVLRANRLTPTAKLSPGQSFHSLRHTYASLCVAAGIPPFDISRFMGHSKVTTTLSVYAHMFGDDHADAMAALGAMDRSRPDKNVLPLRRAR